MKSWQRWLVYLVSYVWLGMMVGGFICLINAPRFRQLSLHGMATTGYVVQPICGVHDNVVYSFAVKGKQYQGQSIDNLCQQRRVNQPLTVWYLPDGPEVSTLEEPNLALQNEYVTALIGAVFVPLFFFLAYFLGRKRLIQLWGGQERLS